MIKISIIIPIYNAEKTLKRCLESIVVQSYPELEVVAVDDCSTDGSTEILDAYKTELKNLVVVHHIYNNGVAAARNLGLDYATGDYICWLDADDTLAPKALWKMNDSIGDADILGFDWTLENNGNVRKMRQADWKSPLKAMIAMMQGTMRWNLWMFMAKRSLYETNHIRFSPGKNMAEDMVATFQLMMAAQSRKQIHKALYRYRAPQGHSVSCGMSARQRADISENLAILHDVIFASDYAEKLAPYMNQLKLFLKRPLLVTGKYSDYQLWQIWMSDANSEAFRSVGLPLHTRLLQLMAASHFWWGVKLYSMLLKRLY